MERVVKWLLGIIGQLGYKEIIVLMAIESSFVPLPSELILPPAGYLVFQGRLNLWVTIACGVLGSIIGALFNYALGYFLGRSVLLRYGKYIGLPEKRYNKTEEFFLRHGAISTFIGRLVFGLRHFISFPAGIAKMRIVPFILYTALGASIWSTILTTLGYYLGKEEKLLHQYYHEIGIGLLIFCIFTVAIYTFFYRRRQGQILTTTYMEDKRIE